MNMDNPARKNMFVGFASIVNIKLNHLKENYDVISSINEEESKSC